MQPDEQPKYVILGIHDEEVRSVPGNVARVRLFIGDNGEYVDEDFDLPNLPVAIPREIQQPVYEHMLKDEILKRHKELKDKK